MPTVAIIGRPNVGKSTLFNSILGERRAIESAQANTTRDSISANIRGDKLNLTFMDTAGITSAFAKDATADIEASAREQALDALETSDMILLCLDTRSELTAEDHDVAELLRKKMKPTTPLLIVGTKAEKRDAQDTTYEWYGLGLDADIWLTSAKERRGVADLVNICERALITAGHQPRDIDDQEEEQKPLALALIGRPNAGKSTLANALLGRDEVITSPRAGTTRDQIDLEMMYHKEKIHLIDTAGVRKKAKMNNEELERESRNQAIRALTRCDVAVLVVDSEEGITHQDQVLIGLAQELGCGLILALNKWDKLREEMQEVYQRRVDKAQERGAEGPDEEVLTRLLAGRHRYAIRQAQHELAWLQWVPVVTLSALERKGITKIITTAKAVQEERSKRIPTRELNIFLQQAMERHPPSTSTGKPLRAKYFSQVEINPPLFVMFLSGKEQSPHFSFVRYLENQLRELYGFWGVPLRIEWRQGQGYDPRRRKK